MKIKKFLSVAIGLVESNGKVSEQGYSADTLYDLIQELEAILKHKGIEYDGGEKTLECKNGIIKLKVVDELGNGMPAEIKCYPMSEKDSFNAYRSTPGKIEFTLIYTDIKGNATIKLPLARKMGFKKEDRHIEEIKRYRLEITKGSEYEVNITEACVQEGQVTDVTVTLKRIVNMMEQSWYAGDLHHHSIYSSPVHGGTDPVTESVEEVANAMMAKGLSFGALSDHHNIFNHNEWKRTKTSQFLPLVSKEISTTNGHVMSLNVDKDVIYDIPKPENRTTEVLKAEFIRITDEIKQLGGLPQINHPRDLSPEISLSEEMTDVIDIFETMEIWNGSNPMLEGTANYEAFKLWFRLLKEGRFIPATTGSDTHNTRANDYHDILDKLSWLIESLRSMIEQFSDEEQKQIKYLIFLYDETVPLLKKWAEKNLGTGGVRTYIYVEDTFNETNILNSLRKGHSILTNGPLLIPKINGKMPGETVMTNESELDIELTIIANKPLEYLYIYGNGEKLYTLPLDTKDISEGGYKYSRQLKGIQLEGIEWVVFIADSDYTNMVITNPIFIKKLE